jgi:two-component system LytT family response regulator
MRFQTTALNRPDGIAPRVSPSPVLGGPMSSAALTERTSHAATTLTAVIVDDEPLARERIRQLLAEEASRFRVATECRNGEEAVKAIRELSPDLVFLDIQMPDLDGFGVIARVGPERMPPTIFVTAYDDYALDAFDANAVDYLLKPFDRSRFRLAVGRALERIERASGAVDARVLHLLAAPTESKPRYAERLIIRGGGGAAFVRVEDVDWIEASRNYVKIHARGETHRMRETLAHIEESLDPDRFVRIHRSTLVNLDRVRRIVPGYGTEWHAELESGVRLVISRAYRRGKIRNLLRS